MPPRAFHAAVSRTRTNAAGQHALGFGLRVGYWPCLRAPYVQVAFGSRRLDIWHGHPSYKAADKDLV